MYSWLNVQIETSRFLHYSCMLALALTGIESARTATQNSFPAIAACMRACGSVTNRQHACIYVVLTYIKYQGITVRSLCMQFTLP